MASSRSTGPSQFTLALTGDVLLDRDDPGSAFEHVGDVLHGADVAIGNNEGVYASDCAYPPSALHQLVVAPRMSEGLRESGFRAMGCANNHMVDGGHRAMLETLERLHSLGIATAGAGKNLREARAPACFEAAGRRVGLLSYTSVFPKGYEARDEHDVPGVAPLRVNTFYEDVEPNVWLPGYLPQVRMAHWQSDLASMVDDVARAAAAVDVLVVALHQGNSQRGGTAIDEYERIAAHAAVDAGASVVFGGHHHSLRGAEIYRGAPIFYCTGNFAFDLPHIETHFPPRLLAEWQERFGENVFGPKEKYPTYPFPPPYRMTSIGLVAIGEEGRVRAGFVPAEIQPDGRPRPCGIDTPDGQRVADHMGRCMEAVSAAWRLEPSESFMAGHGVLEIVPVRPL